MSAELIILWLVLAAGFVPLARVVRSPLPRLALAVTVAALAAAAWLGHRTLRDREAHRARLLEKAPREGRPGDYVGSSACRACHPSEFDTWHQSYHRTMTQYPSADNVRGDFNHATAQFDGDTYRFEQDAQGYWVEMVDPDWKYAQLLKQVAYREGRGSAPPPAGDAPRARLPVTLMTGSHHMQTYWVPSRYGNLQFNVPFTYIFEARRWAPRHDVFLLNPDKHYSMQLWNTVCLNCHATAGQPRQNPADKSLDSQAAEMGISCEACHGPGGEHTRVNRSPVRRYARHAAKPNATTGPRDPTIFNPGRADHVKASETCGQCHAIRLKVDSAQWLQHGLQFRPGGDLEKVAPLVHYEDPNAPGTPDRKRSVMEGSFWPDGQVRVSGRDYNGLAASPCFQRGQLSCLSCHSLHGYQSTAHQLAPRMDGNAACLQCHERIAATPERLAAHTHHAAQSSGSLCYNCHMPHTSYGLLKAIRSHTITSPSAQSTLETGRPNACNLCHLDRPLAWTAARLHEWYRQPVPESVARDPLHTNVSSAVWFLLRGDASQRALLAWHAGWNEAVSTSGADWLAPYLAELLVDSYSVVRYIAQRSLRRLPGYTEFDYDYIGPAADRAAARDRARTIWNNRPRSAARPAADPAAVLIRADGTLDENAFQGHRKLRNDRKMELLE